VSTVVKTNCDLLGRPKSLDDDGEDVLRRDIGPLQPNRCLRRPEAASGWRPSSTSLLQVDSRSWPVIAGRGIVRYRPMLGRKVRSRERPETHFLAAAGRPTSGGEQERRCGRRAATGTLRRNVMRSSVLDGRGLVSIESPCRRMPPRGCRLLRERELDLEGCRLDSAVRAEAPAYSRCSRASDTARP